LIIRRGGERRERERERASHESQSPARRKCNKERAAKYARDETSRRGKKDGGEGVLRLHHPQPSTELS